MSATAAPADAGAARRARWLIVSAAVLWSLSALFTQLLRIETPLGLHQPPLTTLQIAFFRALFAGSVMLPLRTLGAARPAWLTPLTHVGSAAVLLPWVLGPPSRTLAQLAFLALFGAVQMGLPYLLMARGLRHVSPQQAGTLTLLEPVL